MRARGVFACPPWCTQPDGEHGYEQHFAPWRYFKLTYEGFEEVEAVETKPVVQVGIRVRLYWDDIDDPDADDIDMKFFMPQDGPVVADSDDVDDVALTVREWQMLHELLQTVRAEFQAAWANETGMEAYDGAEDDENATMTPMPGNGMGVQGTW